MHKGPSSHSLVFPSLIRVELGIAKKKKNLLSCFFLHPLTAWSNRQSPTVTDLLHNLSDKDVTSLGTPSHTFYVIAERLSAANNTSKTEFAN